MTSGRMIGWVGATALLAFVPAGETRAQGGCDARWAEGLFQASGTDGIVRALAVFDDGTGPALYVGGSFESAGGVAAGNFAKWNGTRWSEAGGGTDGPIEAMISFDDGSGPALYVGGSFQTAGGVTVNGVARWDGESWSALAGGVGGLVPTVYALAVFDDGGGPALYAGGEFTTAGGVTVNRIARWTGQGWLGVGGGVSGAPAFQRSRVEAMTVFDPPGEAEGPGLYAGGNFTKAGVVAVNRLARWDGTNWSAVGGGTSGDVYALTVFDPAGEEAGPGLYVGGSFTTAGDVTANSIARWDGASWSALGSGVKGIETYPAPVSVLGVFGAMGSETGPSLYAGGSFFQAGGASAYNIARWDGQSWVAMDAGAGSTMEGAVVALAMFDPSGESGGSALYVGGGFNEVGTSTPRGGSIEANGIARWDGRAWSPLATGIGGFSPMPNLGSVHALEVFDDGAGAALYAAGGFTSAGCLVAKRIAKWDGQRWWAMAGGLDRSAHALAAFDPPGPEGPGLYVGGEFTMAGDVPAGGIAKWDGQGWSAVGTGVYGKVYALTVFDDGTGLALYAGGSFTTAGGVTAEKIAKWDGQAWSAVGGGLGAISSVRALAAYDPPGDEIGPRLYAGGNGLAQWDGSAWTWADTRLYGDVRALTAYDPPGEEGPALYIGGAEIGVTQSSIVKWDGAAVSAVGGGLSSTGYYVLALKVCDDGTGPALYAGGDFRVGDGAPSEFIARWDGASWQTMDGGMDGRVRALEVFPEWEDGALYAGGDFSVAGGVGSAYIAKWYRPSWEADLDNDCDVDGFDFLTFANCFNGSGRAALAACENAAADIDADGDVDGVDFMTFANCYGGSDRTPLCE